MTKEIEVIRPIQHTGEQRTWTNYSFYEDMYWAGDRLNGRFSQELSVVCAGQGTQGFYYQIQIVEGPELVGTCSGKQVMQIVTR